MLKETVEQALKELPEWEAPEPYEGMPHGDMPGDKIRIGEEHIRKAKKIFPRLLEELNKLEGDKAVVSVFGGSGVGKSEIASLLAYYLEAVGIGTYVLSGDNYPRRIPLYNDAERLSVFRSNGLKGMLFTGTYNPMMQEVLDGLWKEETDADPKQAQLYPAMMAYQNFGREALKEYLGTPKEQDYDEINEKIRLFRSGSEKVWFKRMGRTEEERWYEAVGLWNTKVLIIEWTHGGNENLEGVDIGILLNSTPEETREHRRLRARDGKTDSAFTTMVLEIEQEELMRRAPYAKIILSKAGEFLDPKDF